MSWFDRQVRGRDRDEVMREHARYVRAAGVDVALDGVAGPYGLRRFIVRFAARPTGAGRFQVELTDILAMPLAAGGGPPPQDPTGDHRVRLEQALRRLHANMSVGPAWSRGAIGYVRDGKGHTQLVLWFDEDVDGARIDDLRVPPGQGHPLEQPAWFRLLAHLEHKMAQLHSRSSSMPTDHDLWEVDDGVLLQHFGALGPGPDGEERFARTQRFRCEPLAVYFPRHQRLAWQTTRRPGGSLFADDELVADWTGAHEVALAAATELGAAWLFSGEFGDRGERLYCAVFDGPVFRGPGGGGPGGGGPGGGGRG
ncbi:MAG: hypothetical protein H6742_08100 [Alphaproteobacteria bacterium]|nr:hypothetical protein [Alphaproteobacteria bacterium]